MNCIEARGRVLVQPGRCDVDLNNHIRACPGCAAFARRATDLEQRIGIAIAVSVPRELPSVVAEATLRAYGRQRRRFIATAAAAGAAALGAGLAAIRARDDAEALAAIDFVVDEEANAILSADPPDPAALRRVAAVLGIRLPAQLGELRYIGTCPFMGAIAHHIIAATAYGKVTLLLMPGHDIDGRKSARARGLRAVVCPARAGCLAIIGESARGISRVVEMLLAGPLHAT